MKGCVETKLQKNISASAESNGVVFLVERGDCLFVDKALAAEMHGVGASLCTCFSVSAPACVSALFVTMPCIQPLLCHKQANAIIVYNDGLHPENSLFSFSCGKSDEKVNMLVSFVCKPIHTSDNNGRNHHRLIFQL